MVEEKWVYKSCPWLGEGLVVAQMKPQPLDLNKIESIRVVEWFEGYPASRKRHNFNSREDLLVDLPEAYWKDDIIQRLKSACELYLQYKDNPEKFLDEHPEYTEEVCEKCGHPYVIYEDLFNDWLFKLVFKPVLEDDKK